MGEGKASGDARTEGQSAHDGPLEPEVIHQVVEVPRPVAEGDLARIWGAVGARVSARLPEDQPMVGGERIDVRLPHPGVAADPVGEKDRIAGAVLLEVDPDVVTSDGMGHGRPPLSFMVKEAPMERSFAQEVKKLQLGQGQVLRGEGILAITKALLQSGVSYVGGYPGAPVSHLLDVLADANEPLLKPMGIYFEQSGSEAAAAALLGASINYPMRGAVTWKSIVGTNVASDALSHVASAGVIGGSVIVIGEDYGEGASILQERTHSTALKSSIPLLDPRNSLDSFARFVGEGFGLSEACNEPVFFSIRIRACHMRGTLRCRDNVRPAISMRSPLGAPSFSIDRINLPPFTYQMEAQKFERRLPAARRYIVERRLNEHFRGDEDHVGIVMQGGLWNTTLRGLSVLGLADTRGRTPIPLLVLNAIHPLVPEELIDFLRGKRRVLVVEEGMPNYIERELKALAHEARLGVEIQGKDLLSPHGEYVPHLVIGGLRRFFA